MFAWSAREMPAIQCEAESLSSSSSKHLSSSFSSTTKPDEDHGERTTLFLATKSSDTSFRHHESANRGGTHFSLVQENGGNSALKRTKSVFSMASSHGSQVSCVSSTSTSNESEYTDHRVDIQLGGSRSCSRESIPLTPEVMGSTTNLLHLRDNNNNNRNSLLSMLPPHNTAVPMETSTEDVPKDASARSELCRFGACVRLHPQGSTQSPDFSNGALRQVLEPHLRRARLMREQARRRAAAAAATAMMMTATPKCQRKQMDELHASIASSMGVPYTSLRHERPFLFDDHSYPLHTMLAQALHVPDLALLHQHYPSTTNSGLSPLRLLLEMDPTRKQAFHAVYDAFVLQFCIPFLHSMAMQNHIFHTSARQDSNVTYRYQAFPTLSVVAPHQHQQPDTISISGPEDHHDDGDDMRGPRCGSADGFSLGYLNFHIPLTASFGTNALYCESHPGREDWHPLQTKAFGLGYLFDGARCLHFDLDNTTDKTRVSLDFRILLYRESSSPVPHHHMVVEDGVLCPDHLLEDEVSSRNAEFYQEAVVDLQRRSHPASMMHGGGGIATKKQRKRQRSPLQLPRNNPSGLPLF